MRYTAEALSKFQKNYAADAAIEPLVEGLQSTWIHFRENGWQRLEQIAEVIAFLRESGALSESLTRHMEEDFSERSIFESEVISTKERLDQENDRDGFKNVSPLLAEHFWTKRYDAVTRMILAHVLIGEGPHLDSAKDMSRGIVPSPNPYMRGILKGEKEPPCKKAEEKTIDSMSEEKGAVVNDTFYVKGRGVVAGLCLKNTRLEDGTVLLAGVYYVPDRETEHYFHSIGLKRGGSLYADDRSIRRLNLETPSTWTPWQAIENDVPHGAQAWAWTVETAGLGPTWCRWRNNRSDFHTPIENPFS